MEKVPFDPGIGKHVGCFSQDIQYLMSQVLSAKAPNQRKFKFQYFYPQMYKTMENTIGFYCGCLLWAYYIKNSQNGCEKEIENNNFYGKIIENNENFDFLYEINFLIDYFDKFQKNINYFLKKTEKIDIFWQKIAKTYKNFLEINNNFTKVKTTNDLKIPEDFNPNISIEEIKKLFDEITVRGNLEKFIEAAHQE